MRDPVRRAWLGALVLSCSACGDGAPTGDDAGSIDADATVRDAGPGPLEPAAVAPPEIAPCPDGWVERMTERGTTFCEPWPDGGPTDCTGGEADFAGGAGCESVGPSCPAGDFPEGLPSDATVHYVLQGASGGDGSASNPYGSIGEAMGIARSGDVVAVGKGRYAEMIGVRSGVTLWGACAAETLLTTSVESTTAGVVTAAGRGGVVRNVRIIDARRPAAFVGDGRELTLENVVVAGVEFAGLLVFGDGHLIADGIVVRDTTSRRINGAGGAALVVLDGSADVRHAAFERNRDLGIVVDGSTAALILEDAVVRGTASNDVDRASGRGIEVANGASADLTAVVVERNREIGVVSWLGGTELLATHLVVRETRVRDSDGAMGVGIAVGRASAEIRRALVDGNVGDGVITQDASLVLEDALVHGTEPLEGLFGRGLEVQLSGTLEARRVAVEANHDVGIFVGGADVEAVMRDVIVHGTRARPADAFQGRGLEVSRGATVEAQRIALTDNRDVGAASFGGARLRVEDLVVEETMRRACADDGCSPAGTGLGAYAGGSIEVSRFRVSSSFLCGVQVAREGNLDLMHGEVTRNQFGACVQVEGYDLDRLSEGVAYRDNDTDLDSTSLPVPDASDDGTLDRSE